ncbi:MAG: DNA polymerase III subunit gamma/tau [Acidobacteriota bacterium]|nr:DNA polymerase III subunit gamma/tau [Acidobacteriota bacterium]
MAYQVLARKYRPQRFADVAGQQHVTVTLMNALTQQRIAHGYIFSGHRGIGKTTIARILACALNCHHAIGSAERPTAEPCGTCDSCTEIRSGSAVDVIEIDAATNRGIDEIRELRDAARYRPARDRYKIYILDEAHQITDAAFNALLKTLEEPPDHIVFMMATTQPEDIPQTVRSRCQHFSFHAVKLADILNELRGIASHENVQADDAALSLLAEAGDGSMRDALSIMDQAIASAPVQDGHPVLSATQIRELMGTVPNTVFEKVFEAVNAGSSAEVISTANTLLDAGNSPAQLARQCVRYLRNCLMARIDGLKPEDVTSEGGGSALLQISADEQRRAARTAALFTEEELTRFLQVMLRTFDELGYRQEQRFHFELGLLKLVHLRRLLPVEELLSQLPGSTGGGTAQATSRATSTAAPRATHSTATAQASATSAATPQSRPAFSPFAPQASSRFEERSEVAPSSTRPSLAVASPGPVAVPRSTHPATPAPVMGSSAPALDPVALSPGRAEPVPEPIRIVPPASAQSSVSVQSPAAAAPTPLSAAAAAPAAMAPAASLEPETLQRAVVEALEAANGQKTAAEALEDATWSIEAGELRIQTTVSKSMLPIAINPEAERILKSTLRQHNAATLKLVLLPGTAANANKAPRPVKTGSVQARALEHPVVQQAQKLFQAEIRTIIDLREGD